MKVSVATQVLSARAAAMLNFAHVIGKGAFLIVLYYFYRSARGHGGRTSNLSVIPTEEIL